MFSLSCQCSKWRASISVEPMNSWPELLCKYMESSVSYRRLIALEHDIDHGNTSLPNPNMVRVIAILC